MSGVGKIDEKTAIRGSDIPRMKVGSRIEHICTGRLGNLAQWTVDGRVKIELDNGCSLFVDQRWLSDYKIAPVSAPATPPEPEWIPWAGGECPVHPEAYVEVRFQHDSPLGPLRTTARNLPWQPGAGNYVTAYNVLWPGPATEPVKRSGEVWVNVYDMGDGVSVDALISHEEVGTARRLMNLPLLACIRAPWTEGQFDEEIAT